MGCSTGWPRPAWRSPPAGSPASLSEETEFPLPVLIGEAEASIRQAALGGYRVEPLCTEHVHRERRHAEQPTNCRMAYVETARIGAECRHDHAAARGGGTAAGCPRAPAAPRARPDAGGPRFRRQLRRNFRAPTARAER